MTYYGTINQMYDAARSSKYGFAACKGIIDTIMGHYMITNGFYFEDCVKVFDRFLETGTLSF